MDVKEGTGHVFHLRLQCEEDCQEACKENRQEEVVFRLGSSLA
jgi:hypothetical protein